MSVLFENKVNFKIFQSLKDLKKYVKIVNTTEQILYECPIFLKIRDTETNSKIKFLRLYETFMLISKVLIFSIFLFSEIHYCSANPLISLKLLHMGITFLLISNVQKLRHLPQSSFSGVLC